ncbi:MAG: hypothetical protein HPY67_09525 [Syntrophaceae bacterium]|nr:hypothetical protein [Syntrophaceae bacterium]
MASVFICAVDDGAAAFAGDPERGCALETVLPFIPEEGRKEALRRLYPDGQCHLWGIRNAQGNLSTWTLMSRDDLVLGYRGRAIISASTVLMTDRNPALAECIWGPHTEGPHELLCFVGRPHVGEVPIVEQMLGYLDREFSGFTRLDPGKCGNILRAFGSLDVFVRLGLRYDFPFSFRHSE